MHLAWISCVDITAAMACLWALARGKSSLEGTTLTAAWGWSLVSLGLAASVQLLMNLADLSPGLASHLQYLAALGTCGPPIAVLGAKRPQHRAWQAIVASLLVILAWPALLRLALDPAGRLDLHATWSIFLVALWLAGWPNYLPTRFRSSAVLYGACQALLIAPSMWRATPANAVWPAFTGAAALACAAAAAWLPTLVPRSRGARTPLDATWLDFRDAYGAVWGLRVAERFNALAQSQAWPTRLGWRGFDPLPAAPSAPAPNEPRCDEVRQFEALLARFVSPDWIARHSAPAYTGNDGPR